MQAGHRMRTFGKAAFESCPTPKCRFQRLLNAQIVNHTIKLDANRVAGGPPVVVHHFRSRVHLIVLTKNF